MSTAVAEREFATTASLSPVTVSTQVTGEEWDRFLWSEASAGVEQLWGWREVFSRAFRQDPLYLVARRDHAIVGVLPLVRFKSLLFGRSLVSLPYANYAGLVAKDAEAARALSTGRGTKPRHSAPRTWSCATSIGMSPSSRT